jgi:hypothetical protein
VEDHSKVPLRTERNYNIDLFGKIVGDIDFKLISATENSNKSQKTRFWKEN